MRTVRVNRMGLFSTPEPVSARPNQAHPATKRNLIVFFSILMAVFILAGCGEKSDVKVVKGRSLELHASPPEIVDKVSYRDTTGGRRVIRPRASNRQLAVIKLVIVNRTALVTPILVDGDAAKLGDRRGERILALDPFVDSKPADAVSPEDDLYAPFLWGKTELDRNFQVEGHIVFDVPKGLILGSLFWDEVDSIVVDFVDYSNRRF